jgi:hypothetical protein
MIYNPTMKKHFHAQTQKKQAFVVEVKNPDIMMSYQVLYPVKKPGQIPQLKNKQTQRPQVSSWHGCRSRNRR